MQIDMPTLEYIDSTGAAYALDSEDYTFPESPPKVVELSVRTQADTVLERLRPFDGLDSLNANGQESDLTPQGLRLLSIAKDLKHLCLTAFDGASMPPNAFGVLAAIPMLEDLTVDYSGDGDEALMHFATAAQLRDLGLSGNFGNRGLRYLAQLPRLRKLSLRETRVTDQGMGSLSCLQDLKCLNVMGLPITDDGLREIAKLRGLRSLAVGGRRITDKGVEAISSLRDLEELTLDGSCISDAALKLICALDQLNYLSLEGTRVTDVGVGYLSSASKLRLVLLNDTHATVKGATRFLRLSRAPQCDVHLGTRSVQKAMGGDITTVSDDELWRRAEEDVDRKLKRESEKGSREP